MILHATETGQGAPLALLHGLFGRSQNLGTLARRLAADFRVISLDLRNHGASPHAAGMSYAEMAGDVLETLAARDALPASLLGHSMGGKTAMIAALTQPGAVTSLVVADIAPLAYRHANLAVAKTLLELKLPAGLSRGEADRGLAESIPDPAIRGFLLHNLATGPSPAWRIGLADIAAGMPDIEGFPALGDDARYDGPTLFVRGASSDYVRNDAIPVISAHFPAARLETIADAGHWLHADQPEAFGTCVAEFLRETGHPRGI
jgi:pimeloyl-ACP methyl ester carboxylesterase